MKKYKNFILMAVFTICCLLVVGSVKASRMTFGNQEIVCTPNAIEPGDTSTCYYYGTVTGGEDPMNGFVSLIYTSDDLTIQSMEAENGAARALLLRGGEKAAEKAESAIESAEKKTN